MITDPKVPSIENERREYGNNIADDHQHVIQAGENSNPDHPLPDDVVSLKIEIKRLVIRTISQMMPDVTLSKKMKRRWEEKSHQHARNLVGRSIRKEHRVLGFMNDRINGVHQDAEGDSEGENEPPMMSMGGGPKAGGQGRELRRDDPHVQHAWNAMGGSRFGLDHGDPNASTSSLYRLRLLKTTDAGDVNQ